MSSTKREEEIIAAMIAGASGYVSTGMSSAEFGRAIRVVAEGGMYFEWEAAERMLGKLHEFMEVGPEPGPSVLTDREKTVLSMVARGRRNEQIGRRMGIAATTVRNYITSIRAKLDLKSRVQLVSYAFQHGIVEAPDSDTDAAN